MAEEMTKEEQYKLAMIVLAGACGALIIAVIIACCCCIKYQRKLYMGGGRRYVRQSRVSYGQTQWPTVTNYEAYAASRSLETGQTQVYGASGNGQAQVHGASGDCHRASGDCHRGQQGYASAYDWALPTTNTRSNGLLLSPSVTNNSPYLSAITSGPQMNKEGNEYKKVLLNPPSAVCTKPPMMSTQLAGSCTTGGGGCDGKFFSSGGQPMASTTAQFVLESASSMQH